MNKIIISFFVASVVLVGCGDAPVITSTDDQSKVEDNIGIPQEEKVKEVADVRAIAKSWIENESPTYLYDGFDLQFDGLRKEGDRFVLTYTFSSRQAGYGDRTGYVLAQIITPHKIIVIMEDEVVVSALIDGTHDELQ